ncbi:MAG: hypothetical protein HY699_07655 [Deltaproteobacteria bacterium]|nr:hypothetical protein [Deltaproteobacteria bacterium]
MNGLDRAALWQRLQPLLDRERWRTALTRDLGLKLISLGVAFGLWAFVNASERDTEQALQVPLELRDIPVAMMVISPRVDFVDIRVSGPRTLLSRIDRKRLSVPLDLAGVRPGPAVFRVTADALALPRGVKIVRITPAQVTLDLERVVRRTVAVRLQTTGALPDGLQMAEVRMSPEAVQLVGPASVVEAVAAVESAPLDLGGAASGVLERELALPEISEFVSSSTDRVAVQVQITEIESERDFRRLEVSVRNTTRRASVQPAAVRLLVRGPKRVVDALELGRGAVYIDAAARPPGSYVVAPQAALPPGVTAIKWEPAVVSLRLMKGQR